MSKALAKSAARAGAFMLASPLLVGYHAARVLLPRDEALAGASEWASLWPGVIGSYVRVAMLRCVLAECSADCRIGFGVLVSKADAVIRRGAYLGPRSAIGLVTIEEDALLGPGVQVLSGPRTHGVDQAGVAIKQQAGAYTRVVIGRGAWIGAGAIVMADVGAGAVVGAGSVVTKPIPPEVVAAGAPARVLRRRDAAEGTPATDGQQLATA